MLLPIQAEQLIAAADQAPYGRGAETIVDTSVRRTWQIGVNRIRISGKHWAETLNGIVGRAAEGLGVEGAVSAELYKLLIYDQGSFFVSHRDTEKAPGMFATLVLALPSLSTGGELIVRHGGHEATLDLRNEEPSEIAFAAFYADCLHEVRPVTSGVRATLIYNLVRAGAGPRPQPPGYDAERARVVDLLSGWANRSEDAPEKIVLALEHAYTPAELGFAALKGADAAVAGVLAAAAPEAGWDLHLALVSIGESGSAEYLGSWRSRRWRHDDEDDEAADEFRAVEVFDRWEALTEWRRPDGAASGLADLPFEKGEIAPPGALDDLAPDEEHFREATGNEGASFERTYRRAALVLWPTARRLAVLNQAGLQVTLPYLEAATERWTSQGADPHSDLLGEAAELATLMIAAWPEREWHERHDDKPTEAGRMLSVLARLGDKERIAKLLALLAKSRGHDIGDNAGIFAAFTILSAPKAADMLRQLVAAHVGAALDACADLLARALNGPFATKPTRLEPAVEALVLGLPGDPTRREVDMLGYRRKADVAPVTVTAIVRVVDAVSEDLAHRAARHILFWPASFDLDRTLVPAMRQLTPRGAKGAEPARELLRLACLQHLRQRAAEPLAPPANWARDATVGCRCEKCQELSRFLTDAGRPTWSLKAAQPIRSHVETTIANARCDVDTHTERRGSPHILVCTKNQASYQRRVAQRTQDLADIELLGRNDGTM